MAHRAALPCLLALALLPGAARAAARASLSIGATVIRGEREPRPAAPARRPASPGRPSAAHAARPPPPGSLRLTASGETRSTEPPRGR